MTAISQFWGPLVTPRLADVCEPRVARIGLLLFLLNVLSLTDLLCTLMANRLGLLNEINPLAGAFLIVGLKSSFVCYKLVLMIAGTTMLWKLRGSRWVLPACTIVVGAYAGLSCVWVQWMWTVIPALEAGTWGR